MTEKITRITQGLGIGLLIFLFSTGCGVPGTINQPKVTPFLGSAKAQAEPHGEAENLAPENTASTTGTDASAPEALPAESMISASQLDAGLKKEKTWQIIDVREPSEFATGHVPQAINIPLGSLEVQMSKIARDREVILICHTGRRAFTAWQTLVSKGYDSQLTKVLVGGMEQWKSLGSGEITESIGGC